MIRMHVRMTARSRCAWRSGSQHSPLLTEPATTRRSSTASVKPEKLEDKKEYKPIALFTEVRTEGSVTGVRRNPRRS